MARGWRKGDLLAYRAARFPRVHPSSAPRQGALKFARSSAQVASRSQVYHGKGSMGQRCTELPREGNGERGSDGVGPWTKARVQEKATATPRTELQRARKGSRKAAARARAAKVAMVRARCASHAASGATAWRQSRSRPLGGDSRAASSANGRWASSRR